MKIVLDNHNHTISSGHAYSTIKETVEEAAKRGMEALSLTDHAPMTPGSCTKMHFLSLPSLPATICGVRVFPGVEVNILNERGEVDLEPRALKRLTTVIASIHSHCYEAGDTEKNTLALMNAMDNPYINILGHPGDPRFMFDIERVVDKAARVGVAVEINNSMADPTCNKYPGFPNLKEIIKACIRKGVYISYGSDSHFYTEVADFAYSEPLIEELGIPEALILNYSVERYLSFVARRRAMNPEAYA